MVSSNETQFGLYLLVLFVMLSLLLDFGFRFIGENTDLWITL